MRTVKEILIVGLFGLGVAFVANSVRAKGALKWTKNYFQFGSEETKPEEHTPSPGQQALDVETVPAQSSSANVNTHSNPTTPPAEEPAPHQEHGYQTVTYDEVFAILNDPDTVNYLNVFVDAREDEAFEEGHIPGAIQADHYQLEDYIDNVMQFAAAAEKVIVYCNGGDCTDSILMCTDLLEAGIAYDAIYLYEGGWQEWTKRGGRVSVGRE